ncbi:MAG: zinc-binding dehydrogenase [Bacteroidia bacterium]|nr:zinc-binding dehydrogenase [Bacteroidia bacterium]
MQKIVIHKPGGYDRLQLEIHPEPQPGPGQVLVRIYAAGVNYADVAIRWGLYDSAKEYVGWPITPGFEYGGVVLEVGEGVTAFAPGQRVFGVNLFGAYSTHLCVPEHLLWPLPSQFSLEQAAGFPAVFMTAYHGLHQLFVLRPGSHLLIHSAAGGVGTALLQLGKIAGCKMTGVVGSTHKVETAKQFGADFVIDKSRQDLWKEAEKIAPEGFDAVFDANGVSTLKQSFLHLRPTGKLITYGFHSMLPKKGGRLNWPKLVWNFLKTPRFSPLNMSNKSIISFNLSFLFAEKDLLQQAMDDMLRWIDEGRILAPQVTTFPLEKVAEAHKFIESGQSTGKLILVNQD